MNDMDRAKALFQTGRYTCVLVKDDTLYTSTLSGVSPMVEFIHSGIELAGFSAADKIVGKAAAMLFVLAGIREVYAPVMSEKAILVFSRYGVRYSSDTRTDVILNRAGTDSCPMDKSVRDIEDPRAAFDAICQTLNILKAQN